MTIELKAHTLKVQRLEQAASVKAGLHFRLMDESRLMGKTGPAYIEEYVKALIEDVGPEILEAARLGKQLGEAIRGKV